MRLWRRAEEKSEGMHSVAQAAAEGASRAKLIEVAVADLRSHLRADRVGVWLAASSGGDELQGQVWDSAQETAPAEWSRLSLNHSMLRGLASQRRASALTFSITSDSSLIGPLLEMRRALWLPVNADRQWVGLLLAASRSRNAEFPREQMESVAAQLSLALELERERRRARERQTDLLFVRQVLAEAENSAAFSSLLARIAESCTKEAGAVFAILGRLAHPEDAAPEFSWASGEPNAAAWLATDVLKRLWQQALESRQVVGDEPRGVRCGTECARVLALPIEIFGQRLGVLIAGLSASASELHTLERLELRASLAGAVMGRWRRAEADAQQGILARAWLGPLAEPFLLLDPQGGIAGLSQGAHRLLGSGIENPIGLSSSQLCVESDRERFAAWCANSLPGTEGSVSGPDVELFNGTVVRLHLPIPMGGAFAALRFEPAAAKTAPAAVAEAELHTVLEWMEQGAVLFDSQEQVRAINTRFAQIAGIDTKEIADIRTLDALISRIAPQAADPQALAQRWHELALLEDGGVREEIQLVRPVPRVLERAARPVLDSAGRRLGWLEIYRDLTAQRVFQSRILQTEKLAVLGQMVTGIAHELSNPLTTILGYAQRLLLNEGNQIGGEVQQIHQEAERAARILRQLLQSGRDSKPERRLLSPNQVVLRALEARRFGFSPEAIRIEMDLDPTAPLIFGDDDQLQQVVMNLIGNAQQAIEQDRGRGTIHISTRGTGDRHARLEVSDDGPGIPAGILSRIFDPFFTTKPAGVGTGLGLSIVLGIIREHGGQVHASNTAGGGARFIIELPAAQSFGSRLALPQTQRPSVPSRLSFQPPSAAGGSSQILSTRVLIVEDEPTVARLIADVLTEEGLSVDVLLDGSEALLRAGQNHYDLAICDMKMPGLDGQHFYQALTRTGNPLREHVIFVTGDALASPARVFLQRNGLVCVSKPFHVEELLQAVRQALPALSSATIKQAAARNL